MNALGHRRQSSSLLAAPRSVAVATAIFLYVVSGQVLDTRDPLSSAMSWHVYFQMVAFLLALTVAASLYLGGRISKPVPTSAVLFAAVGILAIVSSARSFWPFFSVVKTVMYLLVVGFALVMYRVTTPAQILRNAYYSIVIVFIIAIVLGLLAPASYPLTAIAEENNRWRVTLFSYENGDFASLTGLAMLIGGLAPIRASAWSQIFLAVLTVASGSKTCVLALVLLFALKLLITSPRHQLTAVACAIGVVATGFLFLVSIQAVSPPHIAGYLERFYGSDLQDEALTLTGRLQLWSDAMPMFYSAAALGYGFDGAREQLLLLAPWAGQSHNGLFEIALAAGGAGLLLFIIGWAVAFARGSSLDAGTNPWMIHAFLLLTAFVGPILTMFQAFGVFLVIILEAWALQASTSPERASAGWPRAALNARLGISRRPHRGSSPVQGYRRTPQLHPSE